MKRQVFFGSVISAALAIGVSAQTGSTGSGAATGSQKQGAQSQQVTLTGCLQADSAGGAAGTSGGASASAGGSRFVLTNAQMSGGAGTSGTGGTGATGSASSGSAGSSAASRYQLMGGNSEELKKYANSKVEVRGRLEGGSGSSAGGSAAGGTGSSASGTGSGSSAAKTGSSDGPTVRVTSVKQIAPSCS